MNENPREIRGLAILAMGNQINRVNSSKYRVHSQSGNGIYLVIKKNQEWECDCPDHTYRHVECKHIHAVHLSLTLRKRVTSENLGFDAIGGFEESCKYCGSTDVVKNGFRKRKRGRVRRFLCRECGHKFVVNVSGFHKMRNNPKIVTLTLDLYFKGVSLRKIVDHLNQFHGIEISHVALLKWIKKYVKMMKGYVDGLIPQVGDQWHTDEMAINIKGQFQWLWNLMDNDTRFLLASQISKRREIKDARKVFAKGKEIAKKEPKVMVTDGLPAYVKAFKKEFFTLRGPRAKHVRKPRFVDPTNNNIIERLQGTIRERDKVMRGIKKEETPITDGYRIYYNFIRPHSELEGKTPAEEAGINLDLRGNKWLDLIKKANSHL